MEVLYLDDRVIVCVKPAGVLSTDEPGGMPELIRRVLGGENAPLRSVHRLDRVVGGVMVYARTRRAASDLSAQIRSGAFEKGYLAVVHGIPEPPRGEMRDRLFRDTRAHKTFVVPEGTENAQDARLSYSVLESEGALSLVSVRLYTGRTHQIRCQLSARGMPICGDTKYGAPSDGGVALWSNTISFAHPRTGERLTFSAMPPDTRPWTLFSYFSSAGKYEE